MIPLDILITRKDTQGGGLDRITLSHLLKEYGYYGEFEIQTTTTDDTLDDYEPIEDLGTLTVNRE